MVMSIYVNQIHGESTEFCSDLVWFYGISTTVGYSMPNQLYTYILDIYDL